MPTTVDFGNTLVNYLDIVPQSARQPVVPADRAQQDRDALRRKASQNRRAAEQRQSASSSPIAGEKFSAIGTQTHKDSEKPPAKISTPTPEMRPTTASETKGMTGTELPARSLSHREKPASRTESPLSRFPMRPKVKDEKPYHREIPQYLIHWDAPENTSRGKRASAVSITHQAPPQLPPYLQKSILTAATNMKDDASVLVLPNHTVLNHLATSSIKDGVLGTSATTRYKQKVGYLGQ